MDVLMRRTITCFSLLVALLLPAAAFPQTGGGERIVVIQEKAISKKYRLELTLLYGWVPTNAFLTYTPVEGRLAFHLSEGFGLEVSGGWYPPLGYGTFKNPINDDLRKPPHYLGVTILEQQVFYVNLDVLWTPVYAKLKIGNWITQGEFYIQLGGGMTGVYDQEHVGRHESDPITFRPAFNFGAGARLWLLSWLSLKLDFKEFLFQKQVGKGGISQHSTLMLGLSFVI
jgi:outer membrane beta-barrel protein